METIDSGDSVEAMEFEVSVEPTGSRWKQRTCEEKTAAVNDEIRRLNQLPANSSYVLHRSKVLSKVLQLLSIQRTQLQEQELDSLFARLAL